jgi:hypothetical protein
MVRRYDEVIEVRETSTSGPAAFLWRGRLYAVRSVLGHWRERRAWWLEGAAARLLGLDPTLGPDRAPDVGADAGADVGAADAGSEVVADLLEREIWRVEAGAGRSDTIGVYDLGRDLTEPGSPSPAAHREQPAEAHWRLLQVAD